MSTSKLHNSAVNAIYAALSSTEPKLMESMFDNLNLTDEEFHTCILLAVQNKSMEALKFLMHSVNINLDSEYRLKLLRKHGPELLTTSLGRNPKKFVQYLLVSGVDFNEEDKSMDGDDHVNVDYREYAKDLRNSFVKDLLHAWTNQYQ